MGAESVLDVLSALTEGSRDVDDDILAVLLSEDFVEERARLLVVVVGVLVGVPTDRTTHDLLSPSVRLVLSGTTE